MSDPTSEKKNRLDQCFGKLRACNEAALVAFVTAGDPWPDIAGTARLVALLADAGADIVELGLPYSDPQADGPTVQASSQRSLDRGMNPPMVLKIVQEARKSTEAPIVLMTYYNPVYRYGLDRFAADASAAGVDGVILTDLPPEEAEQWLAAASKAGLATIFLVAPTSTPERIALIASKMRSGFVYCVSRTGVTGARSDVPVEVAEMISRVRAATDLPLCVGFGISTPQHVTTVSSVADGAVIGSALVDFLHRESVQSPSTLETRLRTMIGDWKRATHRA